MRGNPPHTRLSLAREPSTPAAMRSRRVGPGQRPRGRGHLLDAAPGSPQQRAHLARQPLGVELGVRARPPRRPASAIQRALPVWWSAVACG